MTKEKAAKKTAPVANLAHADLGQSASQDRPSRPAVDQAHQRTGEGRRRGRQAQKPQRHFDLRPAREDEVVGRALSLSKGPLPDRCVRAVFRELISGSRSLEKELRVAYLGPAYSYSHLAAIHRFGQSVELIPVDSIPAVFEEINRRHADFGIVPIENSTDGRVADTLDMFTRLPARFAAKCSCASTTICSAAAGAARSKRSTASRKRSRSAAIG